MGTLDFKGLAGIIVYMDSLLKWHSKKRQRRIQHLERVKANLIEDFAYYCYQVDVSDREVTVFEKEVTKIDKAIESTKHQIKNLRYLRGNG